MTFKYNLFVRINYPSIKNPFDLPCASFIAFRSKSKTSSFGTRSPRFMISDSSFPLSVPAPTSALNKSPVLKWLKPNFSTILAHCVPFPLPGPPKIHMIGTLSLLACNLSRNENNVLLTVQISQWILQLYHNLFPASLVVMGSYIFKHIILYIRLCSYR